MPLYGRAAGDYREHANRTSFNVSAITVSVWVKWNVVAASSRAVIRGTAAGASEWLIGLNATPAHAFLVRPNAANFTATKSGTVIPGQWYHLLGTYSVAQAEVRIYVDGVAGTAAACTTAFSAGSTAVRCFESTAGANHGDCTIAHFGKWNVVLSDDERAALYSGLPPHLVRPDALVIADTLEKKSIDIAGMEPPTDSGNLLDVPRDFPLRRGYLDPVPGPRNITRRRRAKPAAPVSVTPTTAALVLTTYAPTVQTPRVVTPSTVSLTLTRYAPTVLTPRAVTPGTASLTLTTFAPTVTASDNKQVTPSTASLTLTTFAPTVTTTANVSATPATAALTLTTYAPTVTAASAVSVTPTTAALTLTTYAPTVTVGPSGPHGGYGGFPHDKPRAKRAPLSPLRPQPPRRAPSYAHATALALMILDDDGY